MTRKPMTWAEKAVIRMAMSWHKRWSKLLDWPTRGARAVVDDEQLMQACARLAKERTKGKS